MKPQAAKTKKLTQVIPKTLPKEAVQASKYIRQPQLVNKVKTPMLRPKTVAWDSTVGKTEMMKRVRKSGVPAAKKAGMIRQISQNKI